ncbi:hypothetical protein M0R45_001209 [Rubus argutus]|uniref:ABC1 atypical kinase-like domain-containing protein n=1 Tax=Rubus argutus TaxID=59490 RepID=A0AAW1VMA7_RUBAR
MSIVASYLRFIFALRQVPKEYSSTLSSLQDQAVPCHFKAIEEVLIHNLGQELSDTFLSLDEEPIAAASIAQVHRAVLKDHQEVAIKIFLCLLEILVDTFRSIRCSTPGLEQQMKVDTTTIHFLSKSITWFFPEYRFEWLEAEFVQAISLELDFIQEAGNSERTAHNFKNNRWVKVPRVFWDLTTKQVLTMEFCPGHKVDDVDYLKGRKIDPVKVAKFSAEGQNGFSLVLLDHGIYKQLDDGFRTVDSTSALGKGMSVEERRKLKQELKSLQMEDISSFMESLPSDFLTILRTDGLLRSIASKLGASQRVRILIYAKYALYGLSQKSNPESDSAIKVKFSRLMANVSYLRLRIILEVLELLSWIAKVKQLLFTLYEKIGGTLVL